MQELKKRKNFASCTKASNSTVSFDDFDQEVDTKEIKWVNFNFNDLNP